MAQTNYALASNGSTASSANTAAGSVAKTIDGVRHTNNNWPTDGWDGGGPSTPRTLEIDFGASRTIVEIDVFTLADAVNYNTDPTLADTFTLYGLVDFTVDYWNGSIWVNISTVTSNDKVWRQFTFTAITCTKIRVGITSGGNGSRIIEVEAWSPEPVYYKSFTVVKIDADGNRVILPGETIDVDNITASSSLGTLQSDNDGNIAGGTFAAAAGDVIEFSSGSYPEVMRYTLTATELEAYTNPDNATAAFVVEDLSTRAFADTIDYYVKDLDNPDVKPRLIGSGRSTTNAKIAYQTSVAKNLRIVPVSKDINNKVSTADLDIATGYFDIIIPPINSDLVNQTTNTSAENGKVYENTGATSVVKFALPAYTANFTVSFFVMDSDGIEIDATGSDVIYNGTDVSTAAGSLTSTDVGSFITIRGIAGVWAATSATGIWTAA